uniref:Rhodanese domain-containing protein n=1 Tax=Palpitomonas bilix TaxID=652834 RepID=A0A7S3D5J7_9EUKA|mmetsp:Transcript_2297/g.4742  ORF Transcript_2297/g.4742 Transcript_2297/m.4742 type:complete len:294 (+) Transcript_2297:91-972(+)
MLRTVQATASLFSSKRLSTIVVARLFTNGGLVSTDWLKGNLEDPSLRVVHAGDYHIFNAMRIPGSRHLGLASNLKDTELPNTLVRGSVFEGAVANAGISNDNKVVVYNTTTSMTATRAWWVFKRYGLKAAVLDGGLKKWMEDGNTVENTESPKAQPGSFKKTDNDEVYFTYEMLEDAVKDNSVHVVDARTPDEYNGVRVMNARGGHVPGALNISHGTFLDPCTDMLLSDNQLMAVARSAGLPDPKDAKKVVTYCQSGVRATMAAFALEKIGYNVAVYDRSMLEWQNNEHAPLQ